MGRKRDKFPAQRIKSLARQHAAVRAKFPGFCCDIEPSEAVWRGKLQPRALSVTYDVEIRYRLGRPPQARVVSPALMPGAPHVYKGGHLCLYWPKEWVWQGSDEVAATIVPWTALWLYHYELWLDVGRWLGPESDHQGPKDAKHDEEAVPLPPQRER